MQKAKNMTSPTTHWQTTNNANTNTKKHHCQEDSQENDAADGVDAGNGIRTVNGNVAVVKAADHIEAVNAS